MSNPRYSNQTNEEKLSLLYDKQRNLLERQSIHQRNLHKLLKQEAQYGIDVPLHVMNSIEHEQTRISAIEKELVSINEPIKEILSNSVVLPEQSNKINTTVILDDTEYVIEAPYPALGSHSVLSPNGDTLTTFRFVGGFEVQSSTQFNGPMTIRYFRHGRQVSPQIDQAGKKILIPSARNVTVHQLTLSTRDVEMLCDIPQQRIAAGCWTLLAPSKPIETISYYEWPKGYSDYIITTKITYTSGHEVWIVQTIDVPSVSLWFYLDNWHIAPTIDQEHLCLIFPIFENK